MNTEQQQLLAPDPNVTGWNCPYRSGCWQREAVRLIATIAVAILTAYGTACTFRIRAPGLDIDARPTYPTSRAAPVPD